MKQLVFTEVACEQCDSLSAWKGLGLSCFTFMESLSSLTCKAIGDVGTMEFSVYNYFLSFFLALFRHVI